MEEILVNELTEEGMRRVRVVSDAPGRDDLAPTGVPIEKWEDKTLGLHYVEASWAPEGEVVDFQPEGWPRPKRFVIWRLTDQKVSEVIAALAREFLRLFGGKPQFTFMRKLPRGVEEGTGIMFMGVEILLFSAEWMPKNCVAVGGKDCQVSSVTGQEAG